MKRLIEKGKRKAAAMLQESETEEEDDPPPPPKVGVSRHQRQGQTSKNPQKDGPTDYLKFKGKGRYSNVHA